MTDKKKDRIIETKDKDGKDIKVLLKTPTAQEYRDSQVEYNKQFRKALDSGALLRQKLSDYMEEQGIWDKEKQRQNDDYVKKITAKEEVLKRGGIRLSEAKEIALSLRILRNDFREFLSEKNSMDQNSAEGQADNARFTELVRVCMLNPNSKQPYFQNQDDYDAAADQPWVIEAAGELAGMIYGLDPNYDNKLEENKFLKEFDFVNEDLRLQNEEGHLVDGDGRLITEEGRYVDYRTKKDEKAQNEENRFYVNRDGEEVLEVIDEDGTSRWEKPGYDQRSPFLDDDDKPVTSQKEIEAAEAAEESEEEESSEEKTAETASKRKKKSAKIESVETDTDAS
jgi:hypothetical protein|tara:strand:+ start:689 stop:1705 length:1017 start_codon:yes stop_codon:yes gene_type:complete